MPDLSHQIAAGCALIKLLSMEDLPLAQWIVFAELGLEGWIIERPDMDHMYELQKYAKKVNGRAYTDTNESVMYTVGTYDGVPVRVMVKIPREKRSG